MNQLPSQFKSGKGMLDAFYGRERDAQDGYSLRIRIRFFAGRIPRQYDLQ